MTQSRSSHDQVHRIRSTTGSVLSHLQRPDVGTDLLQIVKGVLAATAAWWFSDTVLDSRMPFLAPWTALLTVHATIFRSFSRGLQTTVASTIGVGVSFVIGNLLGVSLWTFALAMFVGLAGARLPWIRDEGVAIATTAIFVLGAGFDSQQPLLADRLLELALGVAVGLVVNLIVVPQLRDHQAARYIDSVNQQMGDVLTDMSDRFHRAWDTEAAQEWFERTEAMSNELDSAWQTVRFARESRRINPRAAVRLRLSRQRRDSAAPAKREDFESILLRVDEGISHLRNLARTLREAPSPDGEWNTWFRQEWAMIVAEAGRSIADPDAEVEPIFDDLERLSAEISRNETLPTTAWPLYGSLITSLRHIIVIVDDVASARQARETR